MRFLLLFLIMLAVPTVAAQADGPSPEAMLTDFAVDFHHDVMAPETLTFGIHLTDLDRFWTVKVHRADSEMNAEVVLKEARPATPTFYYTLDVPTLEKLHTGEWTALTAMGKALASDVTPMDLAVMEGFQPDEQFVTVVVPMTFHFWTRGTPEVVRVGQEAYTRTIHGAQATLLYYQPGLRLGSVLLLPGQHANESEASQSNPFPTYLIMTEGVVTARIGGEERVLTDGEAVFIPPGVNHELMNTTDTPAQLVLVMFGEGA